MGGETQPNNRTYNRQQFLWMAQGSRGFKELVENIGTAKAELIVDLMFNVQVRETNPDDRYILVSSDKATYSAQICNQLETENSQINEKRSYVTVLLKATMAGRLRSNLAEMSEPEANYSDIRQLPHAGTKQREIALAGDWIASSDRGDGKDAIYECLTRHVLTHPSGLAIGSTPEKLLDKIHAEIVAEAPMIRSPNSATAYPSSIGGRILLEQIFKWTSRIIWPGPGEEIWHDVALFYLGAIATVQGYADGNKRAARMAYAITLLKADLPFIAPNMSLQSALVQMEHRGDG
jgi:hypothetical protein